MATSPLYMASRHDLEDAFIAMHPCFKDKESEDNFKLRDQAISKLRRITAGNAPTEFSEAYATGIKALLEGIIKVINSLRTTVSKNGCALIQEMAEAKISNIDNIAEFVLPHLIKLCASTKKIGADKANETTAILITNISYNIHLLKLILSACEDKNVQPRKFATGWLKTLIGKHREHKHVFEKGDGLAVFEKCLKKGLSDSNPDVRQSMRPTYWAFIRLWPERSEAILSALSDAHRKVLISESAATAPAPAPAKAATAAASKSVTTKSVAAKPKQSIKDTIAARRQAVKAEQTSKPSAPEPWSRKSSSGSNKSDKTTVTKPAPLPTATRTLSSAPVRPYRLTRKPTGPASKSAIEVSKSAVVVRKTSPPKSSKNAIEVTKAATSELVKSPVLSKLSEPSKSPTLTKEEPSKSSQSPKAAFMRPLSPGSSGRLGLSPDRELASPPLIVMLRERSRSPAASEDSMRKASETSTASPEDSIRKVSETPTATSEDSIRKVSETPTATSEDSIRKASATSIDLPGNVPCSRKEGLARKALEELSVNEPIRRKRKSKEAVSHEKWMKVERHQLAMSSPEAKCPNSLDNLRQRMNMRINDIKNDTWRISTFREIQYMIRSSWPLLGDDHTLFDMLLFALFDLIDSWNSQLTIVRACGSDHNTQVLLTLRIMLRYHNNLFSAFFPRALCALLSASRRQGNTTHMRFGLEDTIKAVIHECDAGNLEDSIDSVLDFLESYTEEEDRQPEYLGLLALTELMKTSDPARLCRPQDQGTRLGKLAARSLRSRFPELRKRACEFAVTYASFLADDREFWRLTSDLPDDRARLLTYYFTKTRLTKAFRVGGDLIEEQV
ncbi:MAG: hypothetical protein LQ349_001152 [Xanthoria aureola]|nr:MAG: hypothetical protein LQ349_001152 [Xanthoria aureola]